MAKTINKRKSAEPI